MDPATRLRLIRWALLGVPKKNGKTELAAWLALYFLIGDGEPSPLVGCAAGSDEQADLVFGAAKRCAETSPTLSLLCTCYEKEIVVPSIPGSKLRRLSAATGTNDGPSWFVVICDELHEWKGEKGRNLWNILTNGTGAREQPLIIQITTAGFDQDTVCYEQYEYGKRVLSGEVDDPSFLMLWYEPEDPECDYRDMDVIRAVNPSFGHIQQEAFYRDQLRRKSENTFRRYFLNQWTESLEAWLPFGAWESIRRTDGAVEPGDVVVLGFDGSFNNDSTALIGCTVEEHPHLFVINMWERPRREDEFWRVPILEVEDEIRKACKTYSVREIACDPARWARSYQVLEEEGLPVEEFPQTGPRMVPATQRLYEAVVNKTITQDGDPRLARHMANAVTKTDQRGTRLTKDPGQPHKKIDGAVASVMALERAAWWWADENAGFNIF